MNRCSVLRGGICGKNYKGSKEALNNSILEFSEHGALAHPRARAVGAPGPAESEKCDFRFFISMANRQAPLNKAEVPKHSGGVAAYLQGGFHCEELDDVFVAGHGVLITQRDQFAAIILLE